MKARSISLAILFPFFVLCALQGFSYGQTAISVDACCSFDGMQFKEQIYSFNSDKEAEDAVKRILKYAGLQPNFETRAANVPNAMAAIKERKRYILYNQSFMEEMKTQTKTEWAAISILAHEIAHHLQGHTIEADGSAPTLELEADKYSGFILQRMGATLKESCAAMEKFGSEKSSPTHPGKRDRLLAIRNGWQEGKDLGPVGDVKEPPVKKPIVQKKVEVDDDPDEPELKPLKRSSLIRRVEEPPSSMDIQPIAKCVFNDGTVALVLSSNQIVANNAYGQTVPIGEKRFSPDRNFAWIYQTPYSWFGVTRDGAIMGQMNGYPARVGVVTNP